MEDNIVLSIGQIKSKAKAALKGNWGTAIIVIIIFNIIMHGITYVFNANELINSISNLHSFNKENINFGASCIPLIINLILAGPMTYGITKFFINLVRNKEHKIEIMFEGFKHFTGTFIVNIVLSIFSFLWSLLFVIPYIIILFIIIIKQLSTISIGSYNGSSDLNGYMVAILIVLTIVLTIAILMILFRYSMTYYIYIDDPNMGAMKAIKESTIMMKGNKTRFLLLYLSFILWYILGVVTIGIAFLWIIPYIKSCEAVFYYDLKTNKQDDIEEVNTL
ncbi:DUF975 family protein [Clostridium sp. Marseille-Q2269]|uniref:DUF975 family protein n=1 Tax=Clostridium sp. Marseille-Q2269 TaxID=2942205 RepID=UPI0020743B95|nr:DUF975 family protein [Clostridium sp. Marseille-Q2269]